MKKLLSIDYWFLVALFILLFFGILILSGVSSVSSQENFGKSGYYFFHQLYNGIIPGLILGLIAFFTPISFFKKISLPLILLVLVLMPLVFVPGMGIVSGGAQRWLKLGSFSFQPSEALKLSFILYLAAWLESRIKGKSKIHNWQKTFLPFVIILGFIFLFLFLQSNASTLSLIFAVSIIMYFVSGTPLWQVALLVLSGISGLLVLIVLVPYRLKRVLVAFGMLKDPMGLGYQIKQSLITIGSGGIIGAGLGMSGQKFGNFLPQTMSDSIFSVFAEETGFLGSLAIVCFFMFLFFRCVRISQKSHDVFSQLFSIGFGTWICLQAFINIGAMIQIIPLTGIPMPFVSYGGSHIIAELLGAGIVLNISKNK